MIQRFIELGEGFSDIYELCELIKTNEHRYHNVCILSSIKDEKNCISIALMLKPSGESKFMPIYFCREGLTIQPNKLSKRLQLVEKTLQEINQIPHRLEVKHSSFFAEQALYHQYLVGILRLHYVLPPLS